jgi:hypothetical protein
MIESWSFQLVNNYGKLRKTLRVGQAACWQWVSVRQVYGSPNAYTALPAAMATYSFPSTAKAIGGA